MEAALPGASDHCRKIGSLKFLDRIDWQIQTARRETLRAMILSFYRIRLWFYTIISLLVKPYSILILPDCLISWLPDRLLMQRRIFQSQPCFRDNSAHSIQAYIRILQLHGLQGSSIHSKESPDQDYQWSEHPKA